MWRPFWVVLAYVYLIMKKNLFCHAVTRNQHQQECLFLTKKSKNFPPMTNECSDHYNCRNALFFHDHCFFLFESVSVTCVGKPVSQPLSGDKWWFRIVYRYRVKIIDILSLVSISKWVNFVISILISTSCSSNTNTNKSQWATFQFTSHVKYTEISCHDICHL